MALYWSKMSVILAVAVRGRPVDALIPIVIVLVVMFLILGGVAIAAWFEKKRTAALRQVAEQLGFEFFPKDEPKYLETIAAFPLIASRGRQKKLTNLMRGSSENFEVAIFDYSYVIGSGRSSRVVRQTPICLSSPSLQLPQFTLAEKGFWQNVASVFGQQGIELEGHLPFAKMYVLHGADSNAVCQLFNDQIIQFFQSHANLNCHAAGSQMLVFKPRKRLKPEQIGGFLEDALQLLALVDAAS